MGCSGHRVGGSFWNLLERSIHQDKNAAVGDFSSLSWHQDFLRVSKDFKRAVARRIIVDTDDRGVQH